MTLQLELSEVKRSWVESSIQTVLEHAKDGEPFVADTFHNFLPVPDDDHWYGILTATMKRRGLIERIGYRPSTRPERNGAVVAVWQCVERNEKVSDGSEPFAAPSC